MAYNCTSSMVVVLEVCVQPVLSLLLPKLPSGRASTHPLYLTITVTFVINPPLAMPSKSCDNRGLRSIPAWVAAILLLVQLAPISNRSHICHAAHVSIRLREQ